MIVTAVKRTSIRGASPSDASPRCTMSGGVGIVLDTLVGPVLASGSWSFDGRWRTYIGIGRIFR